MIATMTITVKICYDIKSNVIINRFIKHCNKSFLKLKKHFIFLTNSIISN